MTCRGSTPPAGVSGAQPCTVSAGRRQDHREVPVSQRFRCVIRVGAVLSGKPALSSRASGQKLRRNSRLPQDWRQTACLTPDGRGEAAVLQAEPRKAMRSHHLEGQAVSGRPVDAARCAMAGERGQFADRAWVLCGGQHEVQRGPASAEQFRGLGQRARSSCARRTGSNPHRRSGPLRDGPLPQVRHAIGGVACLFPSDGGRSARSPRLRQRARRRSAYRRCSCRRITDESPPGTEVAAARPRTSRRSPQPSS
jgi:hypothetical protein